MFKRSSGKPEAQSGGVFARRILWIALAGAALAAGSIRFCHYTFVRDLPLFSAVALAAGLGLLGAFCILTAAAIGGIRLLIIDPGDRFRPVSALIIALAALAVLIGLMVIGVTA